MQDKAETSPSACVPAGEVRLTELHTAQEHITTPLHIAVPGEALEETQQGD